jgi:hypothetical protein
VLVFCCLSAAPVFANADDDRAKAEIIAHVESIFQAFVDQDRDTIRATHADDWTGFQTGAQDITHGIDAYMANIGFANPMQRYEIEDYDIKLYGDVAVIYYVAQWWSYVPSIEQYVRTRARSVDIYRHEDDGWIQAGSNINILQRPGAAQKEGSEAFLDFVLADTLPR